MWTRLTANDEYDQENYPEVRRRHTYKQPPRKAEGRGVVYEEWNPEAEADGSVLTNNKVALLDLFSGVSSVRVASIASGYQTRLRDPRQCRESSKGLVSRCIAVGQYQDSGNQPPSLC